MLTKLICQDAAFVANNFGLPTLMIKSKNTPNCNQVDFILLFIINLITKTAFF